ncbi:hypothetical protein AMECASPLE_009508 [Ameca splendens]|uniref:HAT C-terminal dimerisation domain-containing protein n=1 Tax=Ameca splendens TaxID=208324 RepID=A0ABV1A7M4_9TELE
MLHKEKLRTELSLIYESPAFWGRCSALTLYQILQSYNLQETSENVVLLNILITTLVTTTGAGRCFSTIKRIKTFLRNTMRQERLNALTMLSMKHGLNQDGADDGSLGASLSLCFCFLCVFMFFEPQFCGVIQ